MKPLACALCLIPVIVALATGSLGWTAVAVAVCGLATVVALIIAFRWVLRDNPARSAAADAWALRPRDMRWSDEFLAWVPRRMNRAQIMWHFAVDALPKRDWYRGHSPPNRKSEIGNPESHARSRTH